MAKRRKPRKGFAGLKGPDGERHTTQSANYYYRTEVSAEEGWCDQAYREFTQGVEDEGAARALGLGRGAHEKLARARRVALDALNAGCEIRRK